VEYEELYMRALSLQSCSAWPNQSPRQKIQAKLTMEEEFGGTLAQRIRTVEYKRL
jgi:hypothetical protein